MTTLDATLSTLHRPKSSTSANAEIKRPSLSIVVPCFNEDAVLDAFYGRMCDAAQESFGSDFEIIFVDDGSKDHTWPMIDRLVVRDKHVVGIKLSRNHGHQLALTAGLSAVRGDVILVIDADLQDPPELLESMFKLMTAEGADVVYGKRRSRLGETQFKKKTAQIFYRLLALSTSTDIPVDAGDFRLMTRRVSDLVVAMPERDRFIRGIVAWLGFKQLPMEYDREVRHAGTSKYPLRKMILLALDGFVGFSMLPLRIAGVLSLGLFLCLFGGALFTIISWFTLDVVKGWTSLTMLILLVSAVQLAVLSVVGEYVGRIYLQSKARPMFIIDNVRRNGE
jgi:polyisoprenyl-phosphate glycosyltransferase